MLAEWVPVGIGSREKRLEKVKRPAETVVLEAYGIDVVKLKAEQKAVLDWYMRSRNA